MLLDIGLTTPDSIMSSCAQHECPSCEQSNDSENIIDSKKVVDCPRNADGQMISFYERYSSLKIECNLLYLKEPGLDDGSMIKKTRVGKKNKNQICRKRLDCREDGCRKFKARKLQLQRKRYKKRNML